MRRAMLAAVLPLAVPLNACAQLPEDPAPPPASPEFYPTRYLGTGDAFNFADFVSQSDARAVLRTEPSDPNGLDRDVDGIACKSNTVPKNLAPVAR